MKPKVSVIIPIYNVEAYLTECLNSIVNQTFDDIEIILVDDGSTDLSSNIMKEFAQKDSRIIIHSQTNKGVSAARNSGISLASGEYILFVDSDDSILENSIETIYKQATETNADIVIGNVLYCFQDGRQLIVFPRTQELNNIIIPGDICFMKFMEINAYPPLTCLYFIKREFIIKNELYFKKNVIHEDELWCVQALFNARRVSLIDFYYYFYRQREGSIMNADNNLFRINSILKVVHELDKFAQEFYKKKYISKESIGYIYLRIFVIYHVMGKLIKKENKNLLSKIKIFPELLIKIYPTLMYNQQRNCLADYWATTSIINNKIEV